MLTASELAALPAGFVWLAWAVFALGGFICLLNGSLVARYYWRRWRKLADEPERHVSAIPIVGSLLVFFMLRTLGSNPAAMAIGVFLIVIDVGSIHWGVIGLIHHVYRTLRKKF